MYILICRATWATVSTTITIDAVVNGTLDVHGGISGDGISNGTLILSQSVGMAVTASWSNYSDIIQVTDVHNGTLAVGQRCIHMLIHTYAHT